MTRSRIHEPFHRSVRDRLIVASAAVTLSVVFAGCPVYFDGDSRNGGEGPCIGSGCPGNYAGCRTSSECAGTDVCIEAKCRARAETCEFSYQCGEGRSCLNGGCTEVCGSDDSVCGSGSSCQSGYCRPRETCNGVTSCADGADCVLGRCLFACGSGNTCQKTADYCAEDGYCRPDWRQRPECMGDTDCAGGAEGKRVCRMGACRTPCSGANAAGDAQCRTADDLIPHCLASSASEFLCYKDAAVPTAECRTERDCPSKLCINAACETN